MDYLPLSDKKNFKLTAFVTCRATNVVGVDGDATDAVFDEAVGGTTTRSIQTCV